MAYRLIWFPIFGHWIQCQRPFRRRSVIRVVRPWHRYETFTGKGDIPPVQHPSGSVGRDNALLAGGIVRG
jgi:hypothetical protein